jgi:hypothetical protein
MPSSLAMSCWGMSHEAKILIDLVAPNSTGYY